MMVLLSLVLNLVLVVFFVKVELKVIIILFNLIVVGIKCLVFFYCFVLKCCLVL